MAFQISPGVSVAEIDTTNSLAVTGPSIGAFAGQFSWGPANVRTLISSENQLVSIFGTPSNANYTSFFSASSFLAYPNTLWNVRAINANTLNATANTLGTGVQVQNETTYTLNYSVGTNPQYGIAYARYPGALGNSLQVSICSSANGFTSTGLTANTVANSNVVTVSANTQTYTAVGDILTVGGTQYKIAGYGASNTVTVSAYSNGPAYPTTTANTLATSTAWQYASLFNSAPGTSLLAQTSGAVNDELHVAIIDRIGSFSGVAGTVLEIYPFASKAIDAINDDGSSNYYVNKIFNRSKYIYVANHVTGSNWGSSVVGTTFSTLGNSTVSLGGGTDTAPTGADITSAYSLFSNPDEVTVNLLFTGGSISGTYDLTIANYALQLAAQRKDCVAFVSPLYQDSVASINLTNIIAYRNSLSPSNSYGVMDSGWKYQFDKYNNVYRYVPLNGDIAGLCAYTDGVRAPWYSPAGFNRGNILNAIKLSYNPSQADRDQLYKNNINPVVAFPGQGIVLYGDKTLQAKSSAFDRIPVRRLFIALEVAIAKAAKYSLFEFNDSFTQAQFISLVDPFLRSVQAGRGIYAYKIVCDSTNNTQQVIDSNGFTGDIYIQPAKSINFIQLNFVAVGTGVSFQEITGRA